MMIDSETLDETKLSEYTKNGLKAIIIAGGYGSRGLQGKILASKFCRENNLPLLGICLGLQTMVIDLCRNILNEPLADSAEF